MPNIVKNIPLMDLMAYLIESVDTPTHVGTLQIFKPVNGTSAEIIERILRAYREGEVGEPFNYYPVFPSFGFPKWAKTDHFDADYHVRHAAVPVPGTERQLIDMVMDIHAGMMDRSRPGWIAYVIEGLEDDCFAVYWKVHHAYIDGASAVMRFEASISKSADELEILPLWGPLFEPSTAKSELSWAELLSGLGQGMELQAKAFSDISKAIGRSVQQARGSLERESPLPFSAPQSIFNKQIFATRNLGVGIAPLGRFKSIAKAFGVSINEVALTVVGAALDAYCEDQGQAVDKQLVATCPMAVRKPGDTDASTQIAAISVKLGNATMDIYERLQQVAASSRDAKDEAKDMSREALMNYLILLGGAATLLSKAPLEKYVAPLTSVNVSNVAGPAYRCFLSGAEMMRSYPVSTLAGGTAINITFSSMGGDMNFAVVTDAQAIPGAQQIADLILSALSDLEAVVSLQSRSETSARFDGKAGSKPALKEKAKAKAKKKPNASVKPRVKKSPAAKKKPATKR